ncbi:probable serine/threonine-protein kinase PIX13 [Olea europaea var. sylvestris]|uniref:probable serine/threonine-protein kinase PIX13 n=1 Tax=Olea europaea var. sylvestris TaxID=158386 RepID=UPI000C1D343F|nr:probable serine/threonine-protein kinase PIX13 [Olea europaea var. sylvestris]
MGPTPSKSHVTTQVMGTHGYAAPEYVATGLRVLDENRPDGKDNLVEWVKPLLFDRRKLKNIMDSRLEGKYHSRSAIHIAQLALSCTESEPKNRPSMREIVEILEHIDSVHEKNRDVMVNSGHRASSRAQKSLQYRSPVHPRRDHSPIHPLHTFSNSSNAKSSSNSSKA